MLRSINPATGKVLKEFAVHSAEQSNTLLQASAAARAGWAALAPRERGAKLRAAGAAMMSQKTMLSELMTAEMGKLIGESEHEVEKCATVFNAYADLADAGDMDDQPVEMDGEETALQRVEPLGSVLLVMPWNYPCYQVVRALGPALVGGNTVVLKHASNVTGSALALEETLAPALGKDVFRTLLVRGRDMKPVIEHAAISAVSLTGSEAAGRSVASIAGGALKKSVLELGGADAFVVLRDSALEFTVAGAMHGRFQNCGQSCIASKRFIVPMGAEGDAFLAAFVARVEALIVGDPTDASTTMGPMASTEFVADIDALVQDARDKGATVLTGGARVAGAPEGSAFYQPTLVTDITPEMRLFHEETFGPVGTVLRYDTEADALALANATEFGLGGSVWTGDVVKGTEFARGMQTGGVAVNSIYKSDGKARVAFGGIGLSGYGRELGGMTAVREFSNVKTIIVNKQ